MKKMKSYLLIIFSCFVIFGFQSSQLIAAEDPAQSQPKKTNKSTNKKTNNNQMELETLKIQGNKELPNVLYIVPWQDTKKRKGKKSNQRLVLHSLYGDLFDPIKPEQ